MLLRTRIKIAQAHGVRVGRLAIAIKQSVKRVKNFGILLEG